MSPSPGTRLGAYQILAPIGAGGMGEVFAADDTRLGRKVAIKVLPEHVADHPERRARFEHEAKAISKLNHPHICTLYDVGEQDGVAFLVMEYIEGQTVAERLKRGALPRDEAIARGIQVLEGLDAAHRAGIVHRDLKPGNVMLAKSGVKLLDFGLAKLVDRREAREGSEAPTELKNDDLTREHAVVGTVGYMAPEQIEGKTADERTDIFAFGLLLYQMLTGKKAFERDSRGAVMAAILDAPPPSLSESGIDFPHELESLMHRCLEKLPDDRWQSARDLAFRLKELASRSEETRTEKRLARKHVTWAAAGIATAIAVVAGFAAGRIGSVDPPSEATYRLSLLAPEGARFGGGFIGTQTPVLSPDGRQIAFVATNHERKQQLWVRSLESGAARALPGTEDAFFPFWSPDGRFLAFFASGALKKVELTGGPPVVLTQATYGRGGAFSPDGTLILFSPNLDTPLYKVSAAGGVAEVVTSFDSERRETSHRLPSFLPDGRRFLFVVQSGQPENSGVYVASLDSAQRVLLPSIRAKAVFGGPDILVFRRENTLMAQRIDPDRLELLGEPVALAESVGGGEQDVFGVATFSVSPSGVLAYRTGGGAALRELSWYDRAGVRIETLGPPAVYTNVGLSPDGRSAAFASLSFETGTETLWLHDTVRQVTSRLTFEYDSGPVFSPQGDRVAFSSFRQGTFDIYTKTISTDEVTRLLSTGDFLMPTDWTSDGKLIVYQNLSTSDLGGIPADGGEPVPLLDTEFVEKDGSVSPDGKWIAYTSNESGRWEVYVQRFPDLGFKQQVSTEGGFQPKWRGDGRELFYLALDQRILSVPLSAGSELAPGTPTVVLDGPVVGHPFNWLYDVTADGQRVLAITSAEADNSPVTIVLNWTKAFQDGS